MVNIVTMFRFYCSNFPNFFRPTAYWVKHFQFNISDFFKPRNPSFQMKCHMKFWCLNRQWKSYSCWSRNKTLIVLPYWTLSWIPSLGSFILNTSCESLLWNPQMLRRFEQHCIIPSQMSSNRPAFHRGLQSAMSYQGGGGKLWDWAESQSNYSGKTPHP